MKRYRIEVAPRARRDLADIRAWYGSHLGPGAAAKVQRTIIDALRALQENPPLADTRADLSPGFYRAVAKQHLIIFMLAGSAVRVVRTVHGARDLPRLLRDED